MTIEIYTKKVMFEIVIEDINGHFSMNRTDWLDIEDTVPPTIDLITDLNMITTTEPQVIRFRVMDNHELVDVEISIYDPNVKKTISGVVLQPEDGIYTLERKLPLLSTHLIIECKAMDRSGNYNERRYSAYPAVSRDDLLLSLNLGIPRSGEEFEIDIPINDIEGIDTTELIWYYDVGEGYYSKIGNSSGIFLVNEFARELLFYLEIWDVFGNSRKFSYSLSILDGIPPRVDIIAFQPVNGRQWEVGVVISDNWDQVRYTISIKADGKRIDPKESGIDEYSIQVPDDARSIIVTVLARDGSDNWDKFEKAFMVKDPIDPIFKDVTWNFTLIDDQQYFIITCSVEDNREVARVTTWIEFDNRSQLEIPMTTLTEGIFEAEVLTGYGPGNLSFFIEVMDDSGRISKIEKYALAIPELTGDIEPDEVEKEDKTLQDPLMIFLMIILIIIIGFLILKLLVQEKKI